MKVEGNSNEKHLNWEPIPSHKGSVTWFLFLAPSKSTPTPSFYVTWKVWLIFIHLHLLYLYLHLPLCSTKKILKSNYKKRHPMMLSWPRLLGLSWSLNLYLDLGLSFFYHELGPLLSSPPSWKGFVIKSNASSSSSLCWCMWLNGFHHPLLFERFCPQIYRVDLEQQPYSCFDNYAHPPGSNVNLQ